MAKRKPTTKTRATRPPTHMPRPMLNSMIRDLAEQIDGHVKTAGAIAIALTQSSAEMTAMEHSLRTVFGILLDGQLRSLRNIQGYARMLSDRS